MSKKRRGRRRESLQTNLIQKEVTNQVFRGVIRSPSLQPVVQLPQQPHVELKDVLHVGKDALKLSRGNEICAVCQRARKELQKDQNIP